MGFLLLALLQPAQPALGLKLDGTLPPRYPPVMIQANIGGTVSLEFVVDTVGRVNRSSLVVLASTNKGFNQPAEEALLRQTFQPSIENGVPVSRRVHLTIQFLRQRPDIGPQTPVWNEIAASNGLVWQTGWMPILRSDPPPAPLGVDVRDAARAVLIAMPVPAHDSSRVLCLKGAPPDVLNQRLLSHFESIPRNLSPPLPCPKSYASMVRTPNDPVPPRGHRDPDYLTIHSSTPWTKDVIRFDVSYGHNLGGTRYSCDAARVGGEWTAYCEAGMRYAY